MNDISLSIVITVFSETYALKETIDRLLKKDTGYIQEILLIVHPDSSSECLRICNDISKSQDMITLHFQKKLPGVGYAIRQGINLARCDYIALLSADLETEPEAVHRMMEKIKLTGCDVVIGNRWLKGGGFYGYDKIKFVLNWLFQKIFKILYLTQLGDLTYGFKVLNKTAAKKIQWKGTLHEIYIETTLRPLKQNYNIEQIPTVWICRGEGSSKNHFFKNFRYVKTAIQILLGK